MRDDTMGQRIRAMRFELGARLKKNVPQERLAKLLTDLGYPTSGRVVGAWERDEYKPGVLQLIGLAEILGVGQRYLLHGENAEAGESEFISRIRALEPLLYARDKRVALAMITAMVRENEDAERLRREDAQAGMTLEQRRSVDEADALGP